MSRQIQGKAILPGPLRHDCEQEFVRAFENFRHLCHSPLRGPAVHGDAAADLEHQRHGPAEPLLHTLSLPKSGRSIEREGKDVNRTYFSAAALYLHTWQQRCEAVVMTGDIGACIQIRDDLSRLDELFHDDLDVIKFLLGMRICCMLSKFCQVFSPPRRLGTGMS
jgi:hypothetical protein